jgi:putative transposase
LQRFDIAMRSWFSNLRTNPAARPPRPIPRDRGRELCFEINRNAKHLDSWSFRLTVLGGHIKNRHAFVKVHIRPGIKVQQVHTIQMQPDDETAFVVYEMPDDTPLAGNGVCTVDLGIRNLAMTYFHTGESILYTGKALLESDQYYAKRKARCKPSGYPEKGRLRDSRQKKMYDAKARNRRTLLIHNLTTDIVRQCVERKVGTLVIGNLKGIREDEAGNGKNFGKQTNQQLHAWPFARITEQLEYKCQDAGIILIQISERGTSSTCPFCRSRKVIRERRGLLKCKACGLIINADLAGAVNIFTKYLLELESLGVEANLPGLPSTCEGESANRGVSQIQPTFVAKFDLRNLAVDVRRCGDRLQHFVKFGQSLHHCNRDCPDGLQSGLPRTEQ